MKINPDELFERQKWTIEQKIDHSIGVIEQFYNYTNGKCVVMFSGGKDSTVLLHLARRIYPEIKAVFVNTTNEFLEILKFVRNTENVDEIRPKITFIDTVKKYGFPLISKITARKIHDIKYPTDRNILTVNLYKTGFNKNGEYHSLLIDEQFDVTNKCCEILKHKPLEKYQKENSVYPIIGTMAENSQTRRKNYLDHGCNILNSKTSKSRPLSIWTDKDIWDYIKMFNVPYCNIYDKGEKNTGCAYCGFGCHLEKESRFERLKTLEPKRYEQMMNLENNGITYSEAIQTILKKSNERGQKKLKTTRNNEKKWYQAAINFDL
jgi:3'-phosphoadenosine 5'-phosphosulfate sulfotransferase (PAPS reductase)/FAD synthetase